METGCKPCCYVIGLREFSGGKGVILNPNIYNIIIHVDIIKIAQSKLKVYHMSQKKQLELAKQGNPNAIAALINRNLSSKGMTAKVSRKDSCLQIIIESDVVSNQDHLIEFIHSGILKLGIANMTTLEVLGRQVGHQAPVWSRVINLEMLSSQVVNQKPISRSQSLQHQHTQSVTSSARSNNASKCQNSSSDENLELLSLRNAAKKGDLQAISSLVCHAISPQSPQNITIEATMQYGVILYLKLYPLETMHPQFYIQSVTSILNDIRPDKIQSVIIAEIASDKKTQVWDKFFTFKNGKLVENTTVENIIFCIVFVLIIAFIGYLYLPTQSATTSSPATSTPVQEYNQSKQYEWYEGGTLHHAGALEWQQASYENKLATCADFVSSVWNNKLLTPSIQSQIESMDDIQVLAEELVTQMDAAMKEHPDSDENRRMYANQKVGEMASLLMVSMGWIK
jgi:predicted transcriptional regulator